MKKLFAVCALACAAVAAFAQTPCAAVPAFTSRAAAVSADEARTVTESFAEALAAAKTITVISGTALERQTAALQFQPADWTDSAKTARLGAALGAGFFITGAITQLGANITVTVTARDIQTLAVIKSEQRQFTPETIWNTAPTYVNNVPYGAGLPVWLPAWASSLSSGITAEYAKQQIALQERLAKEEAARQAELARQEAERKAEETRRYQASYPVTGAWEYGRQGQYPQDSASVYTWLRFNADGAVTGYRDYWSGTEIGTSKGIQEADNLKDHNQVKYSGTYTREGTAIKITWKTVETTAILWEHKANRLTGDRRWEIYHTEKKTASNSADSCSLVFPSNGPVYINWRGSSLKK
jgi:TolB-like protein